MSVRVREGRKGSELGNRRRKQREARVKTEQQNPEPQLKQQQVENKKDWQSRTGGLLMWLAATKKKKMGSNRCL